MTSEQKLARILAIRQIRKELIEFMSAIDFHGMMTLLNSQDPSDLSDGEYKIFIHLKEVINRKDDKSLENDMQQLDAFKLLLANEYDKIVLSLKASVGQ